MNAVRRLAAPTSLWTILMAGSLVCAWLAILVWPIPFWASHDDYAYLSLAHALHLQAILQHEVVGLDLGLVNHPGLPFYVSSWLALRAATSFAGAQDVIGYALVHPDSFFLATRVTAGLVAAAAIAGTMSLGTALAAPWRFVPVLVFFAASPASVRYGLAFLGNETFALPLSVFFFWCLRYLAKAPPDARWPWLALGAVCAVGYTVKLLYLDLAVAAVAVAVVDSYWARERRQPWVFGLACRVGLFTTAFICLTSVLLLLVIRRYATINLLAFHMRVVNHTGLYGTGEVGVLSAQALRDAAGEMFSTPLPYLLIGGIGLTVVRFTAQARVGSVDRGTLLWSTAAIAAALAATAAVLKHYEGHYLVAVSAVLPFLMMPLLGDRWLRWFAAAATLAALCVTVPRVTAEFSDDKRLVASIAQDEAAIAAMPLSPTDARLWTYRVPNKRFAAGFVARVSGVTSLVTTLADPAKQDLSSYAAVRRRYRYIVLDRAAYPDADAVRHAKGSLESSISDPTDPMAMVRFDPRDKIHVLRSVIVVERPAD
jgi:hypothetical protein